MKKAAFLDIDGTLHDGFSTANSILALAKQGIVNKTLTENFTKLLNNDPRRYTNYLNWCKDIDSLTLKIFNGSNKILIKKALINYRKEIEESLFPFTVPLISFLRQNDFEIVLITGSLDFVAEIVADIFEINYANVLSARLAEENGTYITDFAPGHYMDSLDKRQSVLSLAGKYYLPKSIVVADAENDLGMFNLVGKSFLMKDAKTQSSLIEESKQLGAILVDKNANTEIILDLFRSNLP